MSSESQNKNLPFEPKSNRKKLPKTPPITDTNSTEEEQKEVKRKDMVIPDAVGKRMILRMVVLSGVPTTLGILTFIASYFAITKHLLELPHIAVVLVSMGFFGLGVLGLSYGVISTSWDEDNPGSLIGWDEFIINFQRLKSAWKSAREEKQN